MVQRRLKIRLSSGVVFSTDFPGTTMAELRDWLRTEHAEQCGLNDGGGGNSGSRSNNHDLGRLVYQGRLLTDTDNVPPAESTIFYVKSPSSANSNDNNTSTRNARTAAATSTTPPTFPSPSSQQIPTNNNNNNPNDPLSNPLLQSMLQSNPEFFSNLMRQQMQSNPATRALLESHPELRNALDDPAALRQMLDPAARAQALRQADLAMGQAENLPGGMNALRRAYETVQQPLHESMMSGNNSDGRGNGGRGASEASSNESSRVAAGAVGRAMPNPWGSSSTSSSSSRNSSNHTTLNNGGMTNPFAAMTGTNNSSGGLGGEGSMMNPLAAMMGGSGGSGGGNLANPFATAMGSANPFATMGGNSLDSLPNPWANGGDTAGSTANNNSNTTTTANNNNANPMFPSGASLPPDQAEHVLNLLEQNPQLRSQLSSFMTPDRMRAMLPPGMTMSDDQLRQMTELSLNPATMRAALQHQAGQGSGSAGGMFPSLLGGNGAAMPPLFGIPTAPAPLVDLDAVPNPWATTTATTTTPTVDSTTISSSPPPSPSAAAASAAAAAALSTTDPHAQVLVQLRDMGFDDEAACRVALQQGQGDLDRAVELLLVQQQDSSSTSPSNGNNAE